MARVVQLVYEHTDNKNVHYFKPAASPLSYASVLVNKEMQRQCLQGFEVKPGTRAMLVLMEEWES